MTRTTPAEAGRRDLLRGTLRMMAGIRAAVCRPERSCGTLPRVDAPWPAAFYWAAVPLLVVALGLAARRLHAAEPRSLLRALGSRRAPLAFGAATSLFLAWVWGSLAEPAFIHDEQAYLLQARIFASARLSAPPPPLPEFFEQYHVLVTPRLAPKYPPGHALLLVPGVWLGLPGLVPVLLYGVSGGLLFALARRLAGAWVALFAWLVWLSAPMGNVWRCTYLSESTSTAVFMLGAWLLLRWWETARTRDLVGIALLVAWMGITRPLTAVALGAPLAVVVLARSFRARAARDLAKAAAAGAAVLALLPLWSAASTGSWRTLPYTHYSRVYFPYEKLGFGLDPAAPRRELPPDMARYDRGYRQVHLAYTPGALPRALVDRAVGAGRELWGGSAWRPPLVLFFLLGLPSLDRRGWLAMAWVAALFLVYLAYAHLAYWAIYYHEAHPMLAFVTALGLLRLMGWLATGSWRPTPQTASRVAPAAAALAVLAFALGLSDATTTRRQTQERVAYHRAFARAVAAIPDRRAIVFVRYGAAHNSHRSLIENAPDPARARVWVARDRGPDNRSLLGRAPDRVPYLFDEASFTLSPLDPPL
jgi:hypothetical protein